MSIFSNMRKPLTVKRPAAGSYVNGKWVEGNVTEITVKASVQPASTEDLQSLPESRRALGVYKLYSDTKFQSVKENATNPDIVVIDGNDYEVMECQPWQNNILNHYRALAARVQPA